MYYDHIQISKINDFVFCPYSLYFHSVYEDFDKAQYKARPQVAGTIAHKTVDTQKFSSRKNILQGVEIFSNEYGLIGKIDIYDKDKKELIERKRTIKKVYDGYLFQLYAQKLCLEEMGHKVKKMKLYSMTDNKIYSVNLSKRQILQFKDTINRMRHFDLGDKKTANKDKCKNCIYHELCRK